MIDKGELRRRMRRARKALAPVDQERAAGALERQLARLPAFRHSRRVALYFPSDGEIDASGVIDRPWGAGKSYYLPVLTGGLGSPLRFAPVTGDTRFVLNRFRIPEPDVAARALLSAAHLDLVLMPLVAFDARGHRLGMGGGYYDRALAFLRARRRWRHPRLIGVAYDFQLVDRLPAEPWDVMLDGVITDRAWHRAHSD